MAEIFNKLKRGGKDEYAQESAKTDGMCKGGQTGLGSAPSMSDFYMSRSEGYAQESAKTDGMCK
jgi:hypothetical protein